MTLCSYCTWTGRREGEKRKDSYASTRRLSCRKSQTLRPRDIRRCVIINAGERTFLRIRDITRRRPSENTHARARIQPRAGALTAVTATVPVARQTGRGGGHGPLLCVRVATALCCTQVHVIVNDPTLPQASRQLISSRTPKCIINSPHTSRSIYSAYANRSVYQEFLYTVRRCNSHLTQRINKDTLLYVDGGTAEI